MFLLNDDRPDWYEGGFEDHRRAVNAKALRVGIPITVAVQIPFLLFEWLALRPDFLWVQSLRALWLGPALALYPFLRVPSDRLRREIDWVTFAIYAASAVMIVMVAFRHEGYNSPYIHGLICMFVGVGAVTLWHFWFALLFASLVYGAYWIPLLLGHGGIEDLTNWIGYQSFMVGTMGIILVSQQLRLEMARADFERRCQLHEEKEQTRGLVERVTSLRQERVTWLENLASFLRHELKNQIVAVGTSIELAQSGESPSANQIYLERAQRSLNRMRGLVSSATEATSLEAALAVEEMGRVDLSALVMDRIGAFQLLRPSQQLALKLTSRLAVNGNEERLAQLVDKLLNNAHEHLVEGGEIRLELRCPGPDLVELIVENDGDALPHDKERIFEAFVSSHRTADNLGLGLFVAQSIARNHGGGITAEDVPNAAGARFVVTLPAWSDRSLELDEADSLFELASSSPGRVAQPPQ